MRATTFHWEVKTILTQFADALNDIIIRRYNENRVPGDQIHVNFLYSPKTRTLHELTNLAQHIKLPVICIIPQSIRRNTKRVFNKIEGSYWMDTTMGAHNSAWMHLLQPVPVDITVNVSIIARFQTDIDQILTNFIPYTDPYFVVSWKWPDVIPWADFEIRSHCHWNENISFTYPVDIPKTAPYRIIADTSFLIESWMFKDSPGTTGPIYVIDTSFTSVSDMRQYELMKTWENEDNTDWSPTTNWTVISARPQFISCTPFFTYVSPSAERTFTATGYMLDYTARLFVSGNNLNMFSTASSTALSAGYNFYYPFSALSAVSATYIGFSGIEIAHSAWHAIGQNMLSVILAPTATGNFDLIGMNDAGYGRLTVDTIRPTLNPYPPSDPEYHTYVEFQFPCISGIEIRS